MIRGLLPTPSPPAVSLAWLVATAQSSLVPLVLTPQKMGPLLSLIQGSPTRGLACKWSPLNGQIGCPAHCPLTCTRCPLTVPTLPMCPDCCLLARLAASCCGARCVGGGPGCGQGGHRGGRARNSDSGQRGWGRHGQGHVWTWGQNGVGQDFRWCLFPCSWDRTLRHPSLPITSCCLCAVGKQGGHRKKEVTGANVEQVGWGHVSVGVHRASALLVLGPWLLSGVGPLPR